MNQKFKFVVGKQCDANDISMDQAKFFAALDAFDAATADKRMLTETPIIYTPLRKCDCAMQQLLRDGCKCGGV